MKTFVPCSTWRSTGSYANVFYLESFIEELARAAGKDPVEYRRALIAAARPESFEDNAKDDWLLALDTVAEKAGWGRTLPKGTGIGFAIDDRKSVAPRGIALVALAATVSVTPSGEVTVERMDIVHDEGHAIINPEAAERQIRGMMAWGLGPVFSQEITFRNGAVEQTNYDNYAPVKMDRVPEGHRDPLHQDQPLDFRHRRGGRAAGRAGDLQRDPYGDGQARPLAPAQPSGPELDVNHDARLNPLRRRKMLVWS